MKTFKEFITEAKRMRVLKTSHYTSNDAKHSILQRGFEGSRSGAYHPDDNKRTVYTTPSSRVGNDYGRARVTLKIVNPRIKTTNSPSQYREKVKELAKTHTGEELMNKAREISDSQQARNAISKGSKIVRVPDAHEVGRSRGVKGSYIMVDKDVATKSISKNPEPTIKAKNKSRRTMTRPKRK